VAPGKPLMIYDGECNFCKFWIIRWQQATEGKVEYIRLQDPRVRQQFPEIPREQFEESVQFIETNGRIYTGAEAVFRSLVYARGLSWLLWVYQHLPGVEPVAEWMYHFVAGHRDVLSAITRIFWGREGALPSYGLVRSIFLRFLGVIYLSAFVSLGTQINGLIGRNGIEPADQYLKLVNQQLDHAHIGIVRYQWLPTLCWFNCSDGFLQLLCWGGALVSLLLVAGMAPVLCLVLLWVAYLSLSVVGSVFLSFQWDALLLETGFLAIFLAPLTSRLRWSGGPAPSRVIKWLLCWLLFRLMFESGVVKLASGDISWRHLTALNVHYQTQPLPTWIGWYARQLPASFQGLCVGVMFSIELAVPFFIFGPRRLRFAAFFLLVLLQVCILATGNYCYFNLLTIALCLLLLDDAVIRRICRGGRRTGEKGEGSATLGEIQVPIAPPPRRRTDWSPWITLPLATVIMVITSLQLLVVTGLWNSEEPREVLGKVGGWVGPFRSVNTYGLFAVMTTTRLEISVEGSNDGQKWLPYVFKYKPGDPAHRPEFVAPHQPRLDWQMWFAALGTYQENRWFVNFCERLLQGSPDVLALLKENPFPKAPPRYVRAVTYDYRFSTFAERRNQKVWWVRTYAGDYLPPISLRREE